ncbi:type 1 glutamine amidotransferase domain-containing protein [Enterobacterales bacterium CwR94]|nr:type 1 glutamine amidotransferase domain-containing protein [Enterobacterales bacterium CwR94]
MKVLMVLTSHDQLGDTGKQTGFWLEEFAAPWYVFKDAGLNVVLASPKGGQPPLDPSSDLPEAQTESTARFRHDACAQQALANTQRLDSVDAGHFDALFLPGGHGPLWDLTQDPACLALIENMLANKKPVGAVCHAPGVLQHVKQADGTPWVAGKQVTGFTNAEEQAVGLTTVVPYLVEEALTAQGAHFKQAAPWSVFTLTDGYLVTGQNPASSAATAQQVIALLGHG